MKALMLNQTGWHMILAVIAAVFIIAAFWFLVRLLKDRKNKKKLAAFRWSGYVLLVVVSLCACLWNYQLPVSSILPEGIPALEEIAEYSGSPVVVINDNLPSFTQEELDRDEFEYYSPLDSLGRCGYAEALVGRDMMPKDERGEIDSVKPSGYANTVYEDLIEDGFLYNRCHLIGYQFSGQNANIQNLITGTRYMNVEGMEPYENMVASHIRMTRQHVLIRVTPMYKGNDLVCRGVIMEAMSVEDRGKSVCFSIYCYNVQPGVVIDYATGKSRRA